MPQTQESQRNTGRIKREQISKKKVANYTLYILENRREGNIL